MKKKQIFEMKKIIKKNNGITLIALVITIIVLLILAGVTIATLTGDNGILTKASDAKEQTEIADEREKVELSATGALASNNGGEIAQENLETELGKYFTSGKYDVTPGTNEDGTEGYIVTITENDQNGRKYFVNKNGSVTEYTAKEPEEKPEVSDEPSFTRANGVIEIEFLSGTSYNIAEEPNDPSNNMTSDMKKVYWEEDGTEVTEGDSEFDESKWYSYTAQTGDTIVKGTSHWANVKITKDGADSYFVWIPRYAYRIVYFDTKTNADAYRLDNTQTTGIVGYSDARGLVDEEGKTPSDLQEPETSIAVGEKKLRTHPAFETDLDQGGWSSKLEGIWVAKYEVSQSGTTIKSTPGVSSYRSKTIGEMYTLGYNYDRNKESHLMKNSEWGAVAYLTESKYGRNGTAVTSNSAGYYTAGASGATPITNKLQSTTGNEYGIFDTVGGAYEYVAGYIADSSQNYGNSFASTDDTTNNKTESTPYATVYQKTDSNIYTDNYNININKIFGDATTETSTSGSGATSWYSAYSHFVGIDGSSNYPFFVRGGYSNYSGTGSFSFNYGNGNSSSYSSFRVCLAVQ